jgi:predicted nucleic acid-binding protein
VIVVSDTSPLTNPAAIQQFNLLHVLYQEIHIPRAVWSELQANGQSWPGHAEVASAEWIIQHQVTNEPQVVALMLHLDQGEAEAIALALELGSDVVLMDEADGRRIAKRYGLQVVGVLGVLLEAKQRHLIDAVLPHVDMLRQSAGFYLNNRVYQAIRQLANE